MLRSKESTQASSPPPKWCSATELICVLPAEPQKACQKAGCTKAYHRTCYLMSFGLPQGHIIPDKESKEGELGPWCDKCLPASSKKAMLAHVAEFHKRQEKSQDPEATSAPQLSGHAKDAEPVVEKENIPPVANGVTVVPTVISTKSTDDELKSYLEANTDSLTEDSSGCVLLLSGKTIGSGNAAKKTLRSIVYAPAASKDKAKDKRKFFVRVGDEVTFFLNDDYKTVSQPGCVVQMYTTSKNMTWMIVLRIDGDERDLLRSKMSLLVSARAPAEPLSAEQCALAQRVFEENHTSITTRLTLNEGSTATKTSSPGTDSGAVKGMSADIRSLQLSVTAMTVQLNSVDKTLMSIMTASTPDKKGKKSKKEKDERAKIIGELQGIRKQFQSLDKDVRQELKDAIKKLVPTDEIVARASEAAVAALKPMLIELTRKRHREVAEDDAYHSGSPPRRSTMPSPARAF